MGRQSLQLMATYHKISRIRASSKVLLIIISFDSARTLSSAHALGFARVLLKNTKYSGLCTPAFKTAKSFHKIWIMRVFCKHFSCQVQFWWTLACDFAPSTGSFLGSRGRQCSLLAVLPLSWSMNCSTKMAQSYETRVSGRNTCHLFN